jgi:ATP-binding cassette subfamily B protein
MEDTKTILIVDDQRLPRMLLSTSLKEAGYVVCEADGGKTALKLLRERPADVVLLDLIMPEMDGFQVLKQMKNDNLLRNIPVVVVSASEDMESVVRCIKMGAVDHISKPFDPVLLHARVRSALAIRRVHEKGEEQRLAGAAPGSPESAGPEAAQGELIAPADEEQEAKPRRGILGFARSLFHWMRPYRKQAAVVGLFLVVSMAISAALPLGFKFITDYALIPHNMKALVLILVVLVVAEVVVTLSDFGRDYFFAKLSAKLLNDLRYSIFRHLQRLSMGFYGRVSQGEITSRFTIDMAAVDNALSSSLQDMLCQCLLIPFTLVILFALEWRLALLSTLGLYLSMKAEGWVEPRAEKAGRQMKEQQAKIVAVLQENIYAQPVAKMFRLQGLLIERFKHQMVDFCSTAARACSFSYLTYRVPNRCIGVCSLLVIAVGAFLVYHGALTIGELVSFQILLTGVASSISELTWGLPHLLQAGVGMERIEELLNEKPDVIDAADAAPLPRPSREIALADVQFGYSLDRLNLDNVTMTIPLYRTVLLVGPSGCGKSTVLNLLMRFYDPKGGSVSIDGRDIRTVTQDSLREQMSVVLQENFLFNTTIRENIRMGDREATDEEIKAAAVAAEIHEVIMKMPQGYNTVVGERGGKLSGGQRQRVAIARAILSNPAILLLDEATSALDPVTAAAINQALEKIGKGRTVISVTHRLESAPVADGIFVFQEGRLVEHGSHDDLLKSGGLYAHLWHKQTGFSLSEDGSRAQVNAAKLRDIPILEKLDDASLSMVAGLFVTEHFVSHRLVVQQGDAGDRFYIIVRGRVSVTKAGPTGEEQPVAVLDDGDFFGEIALIRKEPRTATVRTLTDCLLLSLMGEHFLRLVETNPRLRESMEQVMNQRTSQTRI